MQYTKELHLQHVAAFWDGRLEVNRSTTVEPNWCPATLPPELELREFFRIKPEPKLRPWKPDEVPLGALHRSMHKRELVSLILMRYPNGFTVSDSASIRVIFFNEATENSEHSTDGGKTWKPCGVEE